jgi:hypothetical protein
MTRKNVVLGVILFLAGLCCGERPVCWAVETTLSWQQVNNNAVWHDRDSAGDVVFDNKMWILGGWYNSSQPSLRDVWNSTDGQHWSQVANSVPYECTEHPVVLAYNNKIWTMSGWHNGRLADAHDGNDVWSSSNGNLWTQATAAASWSSRVAAAGVVYDGKMWLMGGVQGFISDSTNTPLNDVWSSTDGANWTQVTAHAPWAGRGYLQALNFQNKLWVVGGGNYYHDSGRAYGYNDVWNSSDGLNWTQVTVDAAWGSRMWSRATVYDDAMWVVAGSVCGETAGSHGPLLDDVWRSTDGMNWTQMMPADSVWDGRHEVSLYNYGGKMWVAGGFSTNANGVVSDVWSVSAPEPGTAVLLGIALLGLSGYVWRKRSSILIPFEMHNL